MKTAHLRIGTKLALAFAAQIALLAATAAYGLNRMDLMQSNLDEITRINQREAALASSMQVALAERMVALRDADSAASGAESLIEDIISAAQRHADSKATAIIVTQLAPVQARWNAALSRLAQMQTQQNDVVVEGSKAAAAHARLMMGVLAGLSVLGGILLAWAITRSIARPISVLLGSVMSDAARWRQDQATFPGKGLEP
jgi:methyl-accepting chemotaxis protein